MDTTTLELLNQFQRDFPLSPRPFQQIAEHLGWEEAAVLATLQNLQEQGTVSRVGAVFAPRHLGVSTLAALAVPPEDIARIAEQVNSYQEVNHNYQREHIFNLWFVLTAASAARLQSILSTLRSTTGLPLLNLPLLEEFHIDLGFDLHDGLRIRSHSGLSCAAPAQPLPLTAADARLLGVLQGGLPLVAQPYRALAERAQSSEQAVLERIEHWLIQGVIKRVGIIVRHRQLGYRANAMVVWDVPDTQVQRLGQALAAEDGVHLCYRRQRDLPHWRYNLFCMVHGQQRADVLAVIERISAKHGLSDYAGTTLFSTHCFRQRGAYYLPLDPPAVTDMEGA